MKDLILPSRARVRRDEMALLLSISTRKLDRLVAGRIVPYEKIGRVVLFDPEAVVQALKKYERKAAK